MSNTFGVEPPPPPGVTWASEEPPPPPGVTFVDDNSPALGIEPPPPPGVTWAETAPVATTEPVAGGSIARGWYGQKMGIDALRFLTGGLNEDEFTQNLLEGQKNIAAYPKPQSQQELEHDLYDPDGEGFWTGMLQNPGGIPSMLGEMVSSSVSAVPLALGGGAAGTAAAGPIGGIVGASLGVGTAAGLDDFGRSFNLYLQSAGVDFNDPLQVRLALDNKDLVNEATWFAAKRAGVSGALNALGGALGGKFALRFWTPETSLLSKPGAKVAAGLTGISVGTQAATTAGQQVATGMELDPEAIATDAFLAGLANVVPMVVPAAFGRRGNKSRSNDPSGKKVLDEAQKGIDALADEETPAGTAPSAPRPLEPFEGIQPEELQAMRRRVEESGLDSAKPQEWNKFLAPKRDGRIADENGNPLPEPPEAPQILPNRAYATDEPVSKAEIIREIEARQTVVEESEPVVMPRGEGVPETEAPPFKSTLTLSKETPETIIPDPSAPIATSTRGVLTPFAHLATTSQLDTAGHKLLVVDRIEAAESGPLTSAIEEVIVQRVMRWAQQEGYDYVSWPAGKAKVSEATGGPVKLAVAKNVDEATANDLKTVFSDFYRARSQEMASVEAVANSADAPRVRVQVGAKNRPKISYDAVPTREFAQATEQARVAERPTTRGVTNDVTSTTWQNVRATPGWGPLVQAAELGVKVLKAVEEKFHLSKPVHVSFVKGQATTFGDFRLHNGVYEIRVHLDQHAQFPTAAESMYTTLMHEFGHAVALDKWGNVDHSTQTAIMEAWKRAILDPANAQISSQQFGRNIIASKTGNPMDLVGTEGEHLLRRRNFVKVMQLGIPESANYPLWSVFNADRMHFQYELSFAEFFAEQVAKWSITEVKPMTLVERFFSSLYHRINATFQLFTQKLQQLGVTQRAEAEPEIVQWLNSFVQDMNVQFSTGWFTKLGQSVRANLRALRNAGQPTGGGAAPQTPMTTFARGAMTTIYGHGGIPANVAAMAAHGDRFSRFAKFMESLPQVAKRNPHIQALQLYKGTNKLLNDFRNQLIKYSADTLKVWRGIGRKQNEALNNVIRDYAEMRYRTPQEVAAKVSRMPTAVELDAIFTQYGASAETKGLFGRIVKDFEQFLSFYEAQLMEDAQKIGDPLKAAGAMVAVKRKIDAMRKSPYFPFMRFGEFTITIRDRGGVVVHFETFESRKMRDAAYSMAQSVYPASVFDMSRGVLSEDVKPLLGMPPGLIDSISDKLSLSKNQTDMLEQLRYELSPAQSFRHRFQMKNRTSGYSQDFMRAYSSYMFHGSSFLARTKFVDELRSYIKTVRLEQYFMPDGTERGMIANYMDEHLANVVIDAKNDWSHLRGAIFHWALGFNPVAALTNLTQLPILTYPYLADKFGRGIPGWSDAKAMGQMIKSMTSLTTFYRTAALENMPDDVFVAMTRAIQDGVLLEAQAPMLAGTSEGRNLIPFMTRNRAEKAYYYFSQGSAWMFQNAEKMNRRVTFRAAWELGRQNPGSAHVQQVIKENIQSYTQLRSEGWTHQNAAAYVAAVDAVENTQFIYSGWARPRALRGKLGTVLVFKGFMLNTLFTMWNNPGTAVRSLIVLMGMGGLMGIPGAEDAFDIAKTIGYQLFGKDFNLDREIREYVADMSDVDPALIMHGASRRGFGIPALLDAMGTLTGLGDIPFPEVDMSNQVGMGPLLPLETYKVLGPVSDPDAALAGGLQQMSGAAFSVGFNMYRALVNPQLTLGDWKRWQLAMPRALANATHALDVAGTGVERSAKGNPIQTYDPNDTEQLMEIISMGAGFMPLANTQVWDRLRAAAEAKQFWIHKREALMMQLAHAIQIGDAEQRMQVMEGVKKYNQELPSELKTYVLTGDQIRASLESRIKNFEMQKAGLPTQKRDFPLMRELSPAYPMAEVGNRKVRM